MRVNTLRQGSGAGYRVKLSSYRRPTKLARAILIGLLCYAEIGHASPTPTDSELKVLPPYCTARLRESQNPAAWQMWRGTLGQDFIHVHHYCNGLNLINRSYAQSRMPDKRGTLGAALGEFDYVLEHTSPDFALRPEVHLNRGIALSLMKEEGRAIVDLQKAIDLDPKLARAYVALADQYASLKQAGKALEVVTDGLRQVPGNRVLQRRYDELGGKKPYPEPLAKEEPAHGPAQSTGELAPAEIREKRGTAGDTSGEATVPAAEHPENAAARSATSLSEPPAGAKKNNRWCRFCPDDDAAPNQAPSTPPAEPTGPR